MTKNEKRLESNRRKAIINDNLGRFGLSITDDLITAGVFLEDLLPNQKNFFVLSNVNDVCKNQYGINFSVFVQNASLSFMPVNCPIMDLKFLFTFISPIITTSLSTTKQALEFNNDSKIYYYVFDLEIFHNYLRFFDIVADDRVIIIARGDDYRKLLTKEVDKTIYCVDDFCLSEIIRIVSNDKAGPKEISDR